LRGFYYFPQRGGLDYEIETLYHRFRAVADRRRYQRLGGLQGKARVLIREHGGQGAGASAPALGAGFSGVYQKLRHALHF
jgi:hypothetical protein